MTARCFRQGLRGVQRWTTCQYQANAPASSTAICRSTTSVYSDDSLIASTSGPMLPPTVNDLRKGLSAPHSIGVSALDKQLYSDRDSAAGSSVESGQALDEALVRLMSPSKLQPAQLETLRLLSRFNGGMPCLRGQSILAKVLSLDSKRVLLDTGFHGISELPRDDVTISHIYTEDGSIPKRHATNDVRPGDMVRLRVDAIYTPYGDMQLTAVRDDIEQKRKLVWDELRQMMDSKQMITGRVLNECPGGFAVGVAGFVALLPSALATAATTRLVGVRQNFFIISMSEARRQITLRDPNMKRNRF